MNIQEYLHLVKIAFLVRTAQLVVHYEFTIHYYSGLASFQVFSTERVPACLPGWRVMLMFSG